MSGRDSQPSRRIQRIASRIKFLISHIILRDLKDPRIGIVTVLDVKPTEDLKEAKVYVSVFGSAADRSKAEHALLQARGFIQKEVGRNLETRNTPFLRFVFDDSQDRASRIEALIHQVSQEDRESKMAKKPFKKTSKPEYEDEKASKKPQKKGGSPIGDEENEQTAATDEDETGDQVEDSEYDAKAGEDTQEDFDSDFDEEDDEEEEDLDEEEFDEEDEDDEEELDEEESVAGEETDEDAGDEEEEEEDEDEEEDSYDDDQDQDEDFDEEDDYASDER